MSENKYLAIGDIHGCVKSLNKLLEKLSSYRNYIHIFVGDYIDRGPDSSEVIDRLLEVQQQIDCIFLRGNHEQMLLDAYRWGDLDLWLMNGGKSTLKSYGATYDNLSIPDEHMAFYSATKMFVETENYFFVHAGLSPEKTIEESLRDKSLRKKFLWERSHLNALKTPWEKQWYSAIRRALTLFVNQTCWELIPAVFMNLSDSESSRPLFYRSGNSSTNLR